MPLSSFVRNAVLREAGNVLATELTVTLGGSCRFADALDKPLKPNARLKKAMADAGSLIR